MSQPSRPRPRGTEPRRRRDLRIETIQVLEDRQVLTPFLPLAPDVVTFTPSTTTPVTNADLGTVSVSLGTPGAAAAGANFLTAAPVTSVSELTPVTSFGGDIVQIAPGPGGVFGEDVYAISRGAGANAANGAVNDPGVIYRVDPATGKASVFFDLNTVISQIDPGQTAANSVSAESGLVNWYNITFDPEGYFNGQPVMLVTSVDRSDPAKNAIYEISPSGQFLGMFAQFTQGESAMQFNVNPTSILIPPVQDQSFLRGLFAGAGVTLSNTTAFSALYFDANSYTPAQVISSATLPTGVMTTDLTEGPQLGLTASNIDYPSAVYSVFTDFGTPAAGGIAAVPGLSGVQGLDGEFPIAAPPGTAAPAAGTVVPLDEQPEASSLLRRFVSVAFDQYGYFSQGFTLTTNTANTTTTTGNQSNLIITTAGDFTISKSPVDAGNLFVGDLASGLSETVTTVAQGTLGQAGYIPAGLTVQVPVQGNGTIGVASDGNGGAVPLLTNGSTTGTTTPDEYEGTNPNGDIIGGRIMRIQPNGVMTVFAEGFDVSPAQDSTSLANSSLSIGFSADGTILYAADDQAIWQFNTQTDLADSSSGQLIGLNDLRSLGVPYDGLGSAVAIVDTGVDANSTPFRGRVSTGINIVTNGFGNDDLSPGVSTTTTPTPAPTAAAGTTTNTILGTSEDGHGTLVAGVVAQFVPQATLEPVDVFSPFYVQTFTAATTTGTGATGATGAAGTTGATVSGTSNATASTENVYKGMAYVAEHPYVNDPVRPNTVDRVIAATFGFGTTITFPSEEAAYKQYPQIVLAFKGALAQYRKLGIAPIAAAGQFGAPLLAGASAATTGTGATGAAATTTTSTAGGVNNNAENPNVGDNNGMALPAALNDVISVTGSLPFPFSEGPSTPPTDPVTGVIPRPLGPILIYSESTVGGAPSTTGTTGAAAAPTTTLTGDNIGLLTAGNYALGGIFSDRILASANRSWSTDFAAPAIDVPTFRRTFASSTTTTTTTSTTTTDARDHNVFDEGGTSLSAAEVTGAYAMVASALNYWTQLNSTPGGVTSDAYLTTPVGVNTLTFGSHPFINLQAWNNPNGINSILAWTADSAVDPNDGLSASTPPTLADNTPRTIDRISISNAIAAIEGDIAINYLLAHNDFQYIDTNGNGLITAQELQNFEDAAAKMGMPEAGAMARLLGGTAQIPQVGTTAANEAVEEPSVLQRRFNFFDYAADGQLNGSISIAQYKMLAHTLLPTPDSFAITNRARASANGTLLNPTPDRNFQELQHLLPSSQLVPNKIVEKFARVTPKQFKINAGRDQFAGTTFPLYSLFSATQTIQQTSPSSTTSTASPSSTSPASTSPVSTSTTSPTTTPQTAGTLATSPTATTAAATPTPTTTATPTPTTPATTAALTPTTTGTSATSTSATSEADALIQFLQSAINANSGSGTTGTTPSTTPSAPQTAGTLTPTATPTPTTPTASPSVTMSEPPAQTATTPGAPVTAGTLTPVPTPTPTPSPTSTTASSSSATPTTTPTPTPTSSSSPTSEAQLVVHVPTTSTVNDSSPTSVTITPKTPPKKSTSVFNSVLDSIKKLF